MNCYVCQQITEITRNNRIKPKDLIVGTGRATEQTNARRQLALKLATATAPMQVCNRHNLPLWAVGRWNSYIANDKAGFVDYLSLSDIARIIGYKDHTTILYFLKAS